MLELVIKMLLKIYTCKLILFDQIIKECWNDQLTHEAINTFAIAIYFSSRYNILLIFFILEIYYSHPS